jgi:hypothetical protein
LNFIFLINQNSWRNPKMQAAELTIFCLLSVLFLIAGFVLGWLVRENLMISFHRPNVGPLHPEFFNEDGSVNADEVVSLRIEPGFMNDFVEDYEGLFDEDDEGNED